MRTFATKSRAAPVLDPVAPAYVRSFVRTPALRHILHGPRIRPKLKVGAVNDPAEREADRVADRVMRMPGPSPAIAARSGSAPIQRMCAECEEEAQRKPLDESIHRQEEDEEELIQTKEAPGAEPALTAASEGAISGLRSGGSPLPASERTFFEPRFGRSFQNARIHDGPAANAAAKSINARAFTLGNDIAFAGGEYPPHSSAGRQLLAHELAHVVQQSGRADGAEITPGKQRLTAPDQTTIQRRVVDSRVSCRHTGLHGGVPGGTLTGAQAIAILQAADAEAITQGRRAENMLFLQRLTFGTPQYVPDPAFDAALANRFGLSLANPADHATIAIIEREFRSVTDYLDSGLPRYTCRGSTACDADTWAYAVVPGNRLHMCNSFWNAANVSLQGSTLLHEAFHLWWDQVNDAGRPLHNAHCFEQFALDLAGVPVPAAFATSCVV